MWLGPVAVKTYMPNKINTYIYIWFTEGLFLFLHIEIVTDFIVIYIVIVVDLYSALNPRRRHARGA